MPANGGTRWIFRRIKLTQLSRNPGCASKIAPADLDAALARLPTVEDPAVISGLAAAEQTPRRSIIDVCLVQTRGLFPHFAWTTRAFSAESLPAGSFGHLRDGRRTAHGVEVWLSPVKFSRRVTRQNAGAMETFKEAGVLVTAQQHKDNEDELGFAMAADRARRRRRARKNKEVVSPAAAARG